MLLDLYKTPERYHLTLDTLRVTLINFLMLQSIAMMSDSITVLITIKNNLYWGVYMYVRATEKFRPALIKSISKG